MKIRGKGVPPQLAGIVGTALIVLVVLLATQFNRLPLVKEGYVVQAEFAEVGGLKVNDEVIVSGANVGTVDAVELDRGKVLVELRVKDRSVRVGTATDARIVTTTLLGHAAVELVPSGSGQLKDGARIPMDRTSSPYDITSALSDLTTEISDIDGAKLAGALTTVSETFTDTPEDVRKALAGVDQVADTIADNDAVLASLLDSAADVSGVLADRDAQITKLLGSGRGLLQELDSRQDVIVSLLTSTTELTRQLKLLVAENKTHLKPALKELTAVTEVLNDNKENLETAMVGVRNYAIGFGEAISSGPFFDAYIQNLTAPASLVPVLSGILK